MMVDEYCSKFHDRILPEAFRKLLTSHATRGWQLEIQEGIYDLLELFIDLSIARLKTEPVPCVLLKILATVLHLSRVHFFVLQLTMALI
jgi:ubiquitin carboxyl-terminal hydrolase 9/24